MRKSESLDRISPAIVKAQGLLRGAIKDSKNPFFNSKYADLESCWEAVKDPLQQNGLSVIQTMGFIDGAGPTLITTLLHESGQYIEGEQPISAKTASPQDIGSAQTYARRYGLAAIVGLIQVDDDAESAQGRPPQKPVTDISQRAATDTKPTLVGAPECCGKPMYISKYIDQSMGAVPPFYCSQCKSKQKRESA